MNRTFLVGFIAAVIVAVTGAGFIWGVFVRGGNHLAGSIGKVRTLKIADDFTYMVIDFNLKNDSDGDVIVRTMRAELESPDGTTTEGSLVAAADAAAAFHNYPLLGAQYNPVLKDLATIPAHQSLDRMAGVRFDAPIEKVEGRKRITLRIEDLGGSTLELVK